MSALHWAFLRHGQSTANAEGWLAGVADAALTELGHAQARAVQHDVRTFAPTRVWASDLSRATRTAEIACEGLGLSLTQDPRVRERDLGAWTHRSLVDFVQSGDSAVLEGWDATPPEGESLRDVARRGLAFLADIEDPAHPRTLVVAHGAWIRAVVGLWQRRPTSEIGRFKPSNCQLVHGTQPVGGWQALLDAIDVAEG